MAAWKVLKARHLIVSHGRVVRRRVLDSDGLFIVVGGDDDNPVYAEEGLVDHKPVLEAIQTVVKIMERRSKLWGLDAPKRYETLTVDRIDAQIAELEAELAAAGVGPGGRMRRYQLVLAPGEHRHAGGILRTDRSLLEALVRSWERRAFDTVPIMERATFEPEAACGRVVGLSVTGRGLLAIVDLNEKGSALVGRNPVSLPAW